MTHISAISSKASKRLHFLKLLRRAGVTNSDMIMYYKTVIRPVIEYASPLWSSSLTGEQTRQLECIQNRALYIITGSNDYDLQCVLLDIEQIPVRLERLARDFFQKICQPDSCLRGLLPPDRPTDVINRLRRCNELPTIKCRTNRFSKSFIPYSLAHYQLN